MRPAGHTRITRTALRHTIETVTAQAFGVRRRDVAAELEDDAGRLGAAVTVRLALPPLLGQRSESAPGSLFDRSRAARTAILARGQELTGMTLGRVDIRLSGARQSAAASRVDAPGRQPAAPPRNQPRERRTA